MASSAACPPGPKQKRRIVPTFTRSTALPVQRTLDCSKLAFDHLGYPHVLRAIIHESLGQPALHSLRATCTEYRDYVDAIIFNHVVATIPAGQRRGRDIELRSNVSPHRRLPFLPWQAVEPPGARKIIRNEARKRQLGFVRVVDFGSCPESTTIVRDRVRATYTNDMNALAGLLNGNEIENGPPDVMRDDYDDGFDDATSNENTLRSASALIAPFLGAYPSPQPVTIRRRNGLVGAGSVNLQADTYVDYYHFGSSYEHLHLARLVIPPCRQYVLHLAYDPFLPMIWRTVFDIVLPSGIQEVTLVMAPFSHDGPTTADPDHPLGLIRTLVYGFIRMVRNVQLRIVGVENMHPSTLGLLSPTDQLLRPDEVVKTVEAHIRQLVAEPPTDPAEAHNGFRFNWAEPLTLSERHAAADRISLLTFEQWNASLSPKGQSVLAQPPQYEGDWLSGSSNLSPWR